MWARRWNIPYRSTPETVRCVVRINIPPGDRVDVIVATSNGTLARTCAPARSIERGNGAGSSAQEAMVDVERIHVLSRDRSRCVNVLGRGTLPPARACVRYVNWQNERSVWSTQKTVTYIIRINVYTYDRSCIVNAGTLGALVRTGTRARSVEDGDVTIVKTPDVAVVDIVRVNGISGDIPSRIEIIDSTYCRALAGAGARADNVELDDGAVHIRDPQEAVIHVARISPITCNQTSRVDV